MGELKNYTFAEQFKSRTKSFALRVIKLFQALPNTVEAQVLGKQLLRSATSVAANYRSACRARSNNDFISKIGIALEEADEALFWIELLEESGIVAAHLLATLKQESTEITAVLTKARQTSLSRKQS